MHAGWLQAAKLALSSLRADPDKATPAAEGRVPVVLDNVAGVGLPRALATERPAMKTEGSRPGRTKPWVVLHQTYVAGGFGPGKARLDKWRRWLASGGQVHAWDHERLDHDEVARRLAILERYRTEPYHVIVTSWGDVVRNQPHHWRTYHGDRGNDGLGLGVDCKAVDLLMQPTISTVSVERGLDIAAGEALIGYSDRCAVGLYAHRQFSKSKGADPGRLLWQIGMVWADRKGHLVQPAYANGGLPIPRDWM